ncbi:MAG TPA: hypothetical protein V6D14_27895 [Coleofasciculaceae cyanobacterium]
MRSALLYSLRYRLPSEGKKARGEALFCGRRGRNLVAEAGGRVGSSRMRSALFWCNQAIALVLCLFSVSSLSKPSVTSDPLSRLYGHPHRNSGRSDWMRLSSYH